MPDRDPRYPGFVHYCSFFVALAACAPTRLKTYRKKRSSMETERTQLEIVTRGIPEARELERFVRYEAYLSREFDRTLNQLDQMQRKRMGQPATPCIDVKLQ